jgi:hypothetical protein
MGRLTAGNEGGVDGWRARRGRTADSLLRGRAARRGRAGCVRRRAPFFAGGRLGEGGQARSGGAREARARARSGGARAARRGRAQAGHGRLGEGGLARSGGAASAGRGWGERGRSGGAASAARRAWRGERGDGGRAAALLETSEREDAR